MSASIAALSVVNLSRLRSGEIDFNIPDTSNPLAFVIWILQIILLILAVVVNLYLFFFCCATLKELYDDKNSEKEFINSQKRAQKRAEKKCKEYENIAGKILDKLNKEK